MNKSRQKRLAVEERAKRDKLWAEENARVDAQRALFVALPACPEVEALKKAMLDRAWWLLDNCKCEEADAILEFLPWPDARKLLDDFFWPEGSPTPPARSTGRPIYTGPNAEYVNNWAPRDPPGTPGD